MFVTWISNQVSSFYAENKTIQLCIILEWWPLLANHREWRTLVVTWSGSKYIFCAKINGENEKEKENLEPMHPNNMHFHLMNQNLS